MILMDLSQIMHATVVPAIVRSGSESFFKDGGGKHIALNMIRANKVKFAKEFGELVIACDHRRSWRKDYFPYYKANRKTNREASTIDWTAVFGVMDEIREDLKAFFPYRVIHVEGAEGDDVIGRLAHEFGRELGGDPILIISGDKDFAQLQKFANVKQWDPINKKWLRETDPGVFLTKHIYRGDIGDGIPNILSEDSSLVDPSKRQKPLSEKKVASWLASSAPYPAEHERNWVRNRNLIDLDAPVIPETIKSEILNQYYSQSDQPGNRSRLFGYFIKNRLKTLQEAVGDF